MKIFNGEKTLEEKLYAHRSDFVTLIVLGIICIWMRYFIWIGIPLLISAFYPLYKYIKVKKEIKAKSILDNQEIK